MAGNQQHFLAGANAYKEVINRVRNGIAYSGVQYHDAIVPASDALYRQLLAISNEAATRGNTGLFNVLGEMFAAMTRDELIAAKGMYAKMWNLQLNSGGWRIEASPTATQLHS